METIKVKATDLLKMVEKAVLCKHDTVMKLSVEELKQSLKNAIDKNKK